MPDHRASPTSAQAEVTPRRRPSWLLWIKRWRLTRPQRRLSHAILVGLAVATIVLSVQWAGLFISAQERAADYLYAIKGDPGSDIVIVAIDEKSQQLLGDWPWSLDRYVQLLQRLEGAGVVGFDVLLTDPGLDGDRYTPALLDAVRELGNVVVPLATLELNAPKSPGDLHSAGLAVQTYPALRQAAAAVGSVSQVLDRDGTIRRVPLLVDDGADGTWEAFGLPVLRLQLNLGDDPAYLARDRVVIGTETEIVYQVPTDANSSMLINYVGATNTFSSTHTYYSFVDVIEDRVPSSAFEGKIVLIGLMNTLAEMDLHRTPVSTQGMAGVELQANVIHTLLNHRALVPQSQRGVAITVILLSLASALVLSQLGAALGALFTALLALGYFVYTGIQFNAGVLPGVLFPYATIVINYAALMATRFTSERIERSRVTDVFGRFVSPEVRDAIVDVALEDPDLIRPGGRQIEISVLFADIRGFTAIAEILPPAQVVEILNCYLDSMEEQIFEQGGTLDKYTGDGMMVLFGAPLEQPDHAQRAVRAALGMQQAATEVSHQHAERGCTFVYGIGIATGPAVVGHIGSKRRFDYTAIGDTVNLASRLEGVASPDAILISRETYEQVKDIAIVEELEPVRVKGKAQPVPAYKVLGLHQDDDRICEPLDESR